MGLFNNGEIESLKTKLAASERESFFRHIELTVYNIGLGVSMPNGALQGISDSLLILCQLNQIESAKLLFIKSEESINRYYNDSVAAQNKLLKMLSDLGDTKPAFLAWANQKPTSCIEVINSAIEHRDTVVEAINFVRGKLEV